MRALPVIILTSSILTLGLAAGDQRPVQAASPARAAQSLEQPFTAGFIEVRNGAWTSVYRVPDDKRAVIEFVSILSPEGGLSAFQVATLVEGHYWGHTFPAQGQGVPGGNVGMTTTRLYAEPGSEVSVIWWGLGTGFGQGTLSGYLLPAGGEK